MTGVKLVPEKQIKNGMGRQIEAGVWKKIFKAKLYFLPTVSMTFRPSTLSPTEIPNPPKSSKYQSVVELSGISPRLKTSHSATRGPMALLKKSSITSWLIQMKGQKKLTTLLRSYALTLLRSYALTFLRSYALTLLRSYALTFLRSYALTLLRSYQTSFPPWANAVNAAVKIWRNENTACTSGGSRTRWYEPRRWRI